MKRTKARKQRLNNLLIILVLAAVLLIVSTYAWFTANRTVNINGIDVRVATKDGLQISANGIDWKTILARKDLEDAAIALTSADDGYGGYEDAINQMPVNMAPVSSALELNDNGTMKMFYGDISADLVVGSTTYGKYLLKSKQQTDVDVNSATGTGEYYKGYYAAFDIFLKSGNDEKDLYLNVDAYEVTDAENHTVATSKRGIENAARVAIIKGQNTDDVDDVDAIQALSRKVGDGIVMMWEPNSEAHTQKAEDNADLLNWTIPNSGPMTYYGLAKEFATGASDTGIELSTITGEDNPGNRWKEVTPTWTSNASNKTAKQKLPATARTAKNAGSTTSIIDANGNHLEKGVTKCRVYLWIEGQDIDCENYASGTYLSYNLSFSLDS